MDVRTMGILVGVVNVLLAVVLVVQYRLTRARGFHGLGWWAIGQVGVAAGLVVSAARGASGVGQVAIPLFQALLVLGTGAVLVGVRRFVGRPGSARWLIALGVPYVAFVAYFTFVDDRTVLRALALYSTMAVLYAVIAVTLVRLSGSAYRSSARATAAVFAVQSVVSVAVAVAWAASEPIDGEFSTPGVLLAVAYLVTLSATVLSTFGLVAMVVQRLSAEIVVDAHNMRNVFSTSPDCSMIRRIDDGTLDDVNDGFTRLTGFSRTEAIGRTTLDLGLWVDVAARERYVRAIAERESVSDFPMVLRRKDGSTAECIVAGSTLTLHDEPYVISVVRDVTEQRRLEAELLHEATTDSLTGLPNRRDFLASCEQELRRAAHGDGPLAVAVIDVDHFKEVNDTHGHATGDRALVTFSQAVASVIRDVDTCGRLGGDEFALLLPDSDVDRAREVVERLRLELARRSLEANGQQVHIAISAGVAASCPGGDTVDGLLLRADHALYEAKEQGRNRVVAEATLA